MKKSLVQTEKNFAIRAHIVQESLSLHRLHKMRSGHNNDPFFPIILKIGKFLRLYHKKEQDNGARFYKAPHLMLLWHEMIGGTI